MLDAEFVSVPVQASHAPERLSVEKKGIKFCCISQFTMYIGIATKIATWKKHPLNAPLSALRVALSSLEVNTILRTR